MPRILIGPATLIGIDGGYKSVLLEAGFELVDPPHAVQMTEAELIERLAGCDAALAGSEPYTRRVLEAHPQLRIIARSGVGYDAVDVAAATERGIPVTVAPGNSEAVAEHALGLMLAVAKEIVAHHNRIVAGGWPRKSNRPLRGSTLAIIGLGRIGKELAVRARALGMAVIAHDIQPDEAFARRHGVGLVSLDECLAAGDFVSLHVPLTPDTRGLMNADRLARMKPTAILINTSRGPVVDEVALTAALTRGVIGGAGLDVLAVEPPVGDLPLFHAPNLVLTPHTAGVDTAARDAMALIAARAVVDYFAGRWPGEIVVNPGCRVRQS
jgi:phosphoglycerate dehydrogenase-like enzyme